MSRNAVLRALVTQRLTAAAEDILVLFERSIAEYEQEVLLLTHNNSSQQQRPSSEPSHETTADVPILSVREDSAHIKEEPEEQLQESTFAPVCVKTEDDEEQTSVQYPIPTEESREESNGSDFGEEAAPLTPQDSDSEDSDSSETDDSEDYCQEQALDSCEMDCTLTSHSEHIPFSCLECGKTINKKKNIARHLRKHTGDKTFRCLICDKGFSEIPALTKHKRKIHNICPICPKRFNTSSQLKNHMIVHVKDDLKIKKSFCCPECGKRFMQKKTMKNHLKYHSEFEPLQCSVCTEAFPTKRQRINHMRARHMGYRPFVCTVCNRNFTTQYNLTEHMKNHCDERPFSCPVCGKSFVEQMDLTQHLKLIHYICPVCSQGFQDKFTLKSHMSDHSDTQLQEILTPFSCSDCGKRFSRDTALQKHMVIHSEEKTFKCTVCEKCFRNESSLVKHTETHSLECPECRVKMENKAAIELHLCRSHQICSVCKERFTDGDILKEHLKTHSGVCPECGINLKKTNLSLHISRAHRICPVCEEHFTDKVHLKEHLKIHIKDGTLDQSSAQIVNCEECGELFFHKSKLFVHMRVTGHQ